MIVLKNGALTEKNSLPLALANGIIIFKTKGL
jgi:hypothetical protein